MMAVAAMSAWAAATVFWMGIGAAIWRMFFEPRIAELKATIAEDRGRCDKELGAMRDRVHQLETVLLMHGPQELRQQMQLALSEKAKDIREARVGRA